MIEYKIAINTKTIKKLTPPREGLDSLLQRIVTSFLFLIPKERENLNNKTFIEYAIITPPMKNIRS